ncbi:hydroxymethylglutaryl-CoA reductase, degradative [Lacticaseibacillus pabuli]|uniref:3-hydroxy-3-methylglutaryl coenzyme A reductase n=1 Tax=Lacticaseibacillus pabuli TaxID=3025672 RepID=A0ABY7WTP8_9LACO|nr:hydroxymethylglutaryl-CoA reductase, degradative [Lacticaseibacillus sp. KACC 23028]WDF83491.1 hydroxymethylglutaryl-CoA reductase, degradative [Lacticaseibacillus sp. KACC 23028]
MPKFYELSREDRIAQLLADARLSQAAATHLLANEPLPEATAAHLTENQIGQFPLPLGVVHHLQVNGVSREVAIAGEEPSVVAAASNGARMANLGGGVTGVAPDMHVVDAEIVFANAPEVATVVQAHRLQIFTVAESAHPSIVRRGGGLKAIHTDTTGQFTKIILSVDVQEAMGANIVNTIAEAVAAYLEATTGLRRLFAILSNYSEQTTRAEVTIPHAALATKQATGAHIAAQIALASQFAQLDVSRATTNNKGIMNGVSGAAIALGNDYRALEAGVYAFAASTGTYQPLSTWENSEGQLHGVIELPIQVGTVGGAIGALPLAKVSQQLAQITCVREEQEVLASLGLVQNLAALRALVGPGIQSGHMALAAGSLAISAGAKGSEVTVLTAQLQGKKQSLALAKTLLAQIRQQGEDK